jgi:hypothetical protein
MASRCAGRSPARCRLPSRIRGTEKQPRLQRDCFSANLNSLDYRLRAAHCQAANTLSSDVLRRVAGWACTSAKLRRSTVATLMFRTVPAAAVGDVSITHLARVLAKGQAAYGVGTRDRVGALYRVR